MKARFSYQYYGQPVFRLDGLSQLKTKPFENMMEGDYLELTPLDQISDEDLLWCYHKHSEMIAYDYTMDFKGLLQSARLWLQQGGYKDLIKYTVLTDYLRSKSYAMPYIGHSVQQLIEAGYMKLKEGGKQDGKG